MTMNKIIKDPYDDVPAIVVDLIGERQLELDRMNYDGTITSPPPLTKSLLISRLKECERIRSDKIKPNTEIVRLVRITFEKNPGWKIDVFQTSGNKEERSIPVVTGPNGKMYPPFVVHEPSWDVFLGLRPHTLEMDEYEPGQCHCVDCDRAYHDYAIIEDMYRIMG